MADEPIPLKILSSGYTLVPAFWSKLILDGADKGIPASFWKYSLVLWREIVGFNCVQKGFVAKKTMHDFGIRPATAMKWTAAYAVSSLFKVDYGYRHKVDSPGMPTKFTYLDGSQRDWEVFIKCLATILHKDKVNEHDGQDILGFRAQLAIAVFWARKEADLRPFVTKETTAWLAAMEKKGIVTVVREPELSFQIGRLPASKDRIVKLKPGEVREEQTVKIDEW